MTWTQQTNKAFSNYTWIPGKNDRFNALSVSTHEGRVFLGIKGYDKKANAAGYIQAEFDYEAIQALHERLAQLVTVSDLEE